MAEPRAERPDADDRWTSEPEQLHVLRDRDSGAVCVVAVHDTRLGPAFGGIRRWRYDDLDEAVGDVTALARAMTWKCALAGLPAGGGKAVILDREGLDRRAAYALVGRAVAQLGGRFFTGPDVNTTDDDLRVVREHTEFVAVGGDEGPGDLAAATAEGVFLAAGALAARLDLPFDGLRVVVQGLGAVGMGLCERLARAGAQLLVHDVLDARVQQAVQRLGARALQADELLSTPCDVFAPCALGGVLTERSAAELPARGVCGAANNVFASPVAMRALHDRGVLAVPDVIANAGALIQGATWHLTGRRTTDDDLRAIARTADEVLGRSLAERRPPNEIALEVALERLSRSTRGA